MREFSIQKNEAGQRLDKYLKKRLPQAPASFLYKMLRKKNIVVNGGKADGAQMTREGDAVRLYLSEETYLKFASPQKGRTGSASPCTIDLESLPFSILYEDEDILAIDKPSGMLSQKAWPDDVSANEYVLAYLKASGAWDEGRGEAFVPSVCNRLDRNTSGILLAGKTLRGLKDLSGQLAGKKVSKHYRCIVEGKLCEPCRIRGYLRKDARRNKACLSEKKLRDEDKPVETEFEPIRFYGDATLLEARLITGRTHQIRAQLAALGHPVAGDLKYGARKREGIAPHLLHAYKVRLADGTQITSQLPETFARAAALFEKESD